MTATPTYRGEWSPTTVYNSADTIAAGHFDEVQYQGAIWIANFYNVDQNPMVYSTPPGQTTTPNNQHGSAGPGYAWSLAPGQQVNYDTVVPSWGSTTDFKVGHVSPTSVSLFWQAAEVLGVGDVSSYDIYATDTTSGVTFLAGSTTTTAFTVSGLTAGDNYSFSVAANDLLGTSGPDAMTGTAFGNAYTWNENPGAGANPTVSVETPHEIEGPKYYSPYVDMTLPSTDILSMSADSGLRSFTLAFMQETLSTIDGNDNLLAGKSAGISWGGLGTATTESAGTIIQEVKTVEAEGGIVTLAFGGFTGHDPAVVAQHNALSVAQLQAEYQSAITTYGVNHIDFDVENIATVDNFAANHMRDQAIVGLEAANPGLKVTFTLATLPSGLPGLPAGFATNATNDAMAAAGTLPAPNNHPISNDLGVLQQAVADGVHIDVVNIMAMDYFDGDGAPDMAAKAISAANAVHAQLLALGINAKVGITPMIGNNDDTSEVFTLANAHTLEAFAASTPWVAGLGIWELPHDQFEATDNLHAAPVQNQSGVAEEAYGFSNIFKQIEVQSTDDPDNIVDDDDGHTLQGLGGADTINGNGGNDVIDGGTGADQMTGGLGNDTFYVDNSLDKVFEAVNGGTDTVLASLSFTLAAGQEIEMLETTLASGTTAINLTGNEFAQTLIGNAGANVLDGKGGADTMQGLGGSDTYIVDNALDKVIEAVGGGTDNLHASVSYVLAAGQEVETLATNLQSGTSAINLTGNEFIQTLIGNAGANVLDGRGGADIMQGLGGNDTYVVDNALDKVIEAVNGGTDNLHASVSYVLAAGQEVETLATNLQSGTAAINLTGNEFIQSLIGNAGANILNGGLGNDTLTGLGGADTFAFSTALNATTNLDHIADFAPVDDTMQLSHAIFGALPTGALTAGFHSGAGLTIASGSDHIIYNTTTGALYYDADGQGGAAATEFAVLDNHAAITAADFMII